MRDLVLIPGLNNMAAVFDAVVAGLEGEVRVHAVDCPALADVDAIAEALLQDLPERFWLAGFSFGGYVAMAMLARAPQRVEGVALICSSPAADQPTQHAARQAAIDRARQGDYLGMIDAQAAQAFHADSLGDAALMQRRRDMVALYGVERFIAHQRASMGRPDRSALLDGSRPTAIVAASHDRLFAPAALQELAAQIPGAQYLQIADAGHLMPMEQPERLCQALRRWLG